MWFSHIQQRKKYNQTLYRHIEIELPEHVGREELILDLDLNLEHLKVP